MKVITRIPPSPTGHLHIGTARTALFNYLFARKSNGKVLYRSEDTDKERSKRNFEEEIVKGLQDLGIVWENANSVVRQSERHKIYKTYLLKAIDDNLVYVSREPSIQDETVMVEVVRLKNPNKQIVFKDLVRGDITFDTTELGDFVIARSIDDALYHFTVVVDDHEMGVTHVIRGEDHISNTPRQILIQEVLGFQRPEYAHLPLILAPDRSKMSKRHGAISVNEYIEKGYLPSALINYLALLGWNPGTDQEVFSLEELVNVFDLSEVQKSGAIFNEEKLQWLNKEHLNRMTDSEYVAYVAKWLPEHIDTSNRRFQRLLPSLRERVTLGNEVSSLFESGDFSFVFSEPKFENDLLKWKNDISVSDVFPRLQHCLKVLPASDFSSVSNIKDSLWSYAEEIGKGELLWPLRIALTGLERSPDPFTCLFILGKEESLKRIGAVVE